MFIEPHISKGGWIEVVCGSMFSGKTEELIRRLKRARIANLGVGIFKPSIDTRYHAKSIVSHNENMIDAIPVLSSYEILEKSVDFDVIGLDETVKAIWDNGFALKLATNKLFDVKLGI
jgi:thymidine kinase